MYYVDCTPITFANLLINVSFVNLQMSPDTKQKETQQCKSKQMTIFVLTNLPQGNIITKTKAARD